MTLYVYLLSFHYSDGSQSGILYYMVYSYIIIYVNIKHMYIKQLSTQY